jgi:hypothetical protein
MAYRFEIERIDANIKETKETYFQMLRSNGLGIV